MNHPKHPDPKGVQPYSYAPLLGPAGDHRKLDELELTLDRQVEDLIGSQSQQKTLLLDQLKQCAALAPSILPEEEIVPWRKAIDEFITYSTSTHPRINPRAHHAPRDWSAELLQPLRRAATVTALSSNSRALARSFKSDGEHHAALREWHHIVRLAKECTAFDHIAHLRERIFAIGTNMSPESWQPFREAMIGAITQYEKAGGDMRLRDLPLHDRLQKLKGDPRGWFEVQADLQCMGETFEEHYKGNSWTTGKATRLYRSGAETLHRDADRSDRSATLETLFATRWTRVAQAINSRLTIYEHLLKDPSITVDPDSHFMDCVRERAARLHDERILG